MAKTPKISEAEWEIMRIVWDKNPITSREVNQRLAPEKDWNPKTVGTLLSRLVKKGALKYRAKRTVYYYSPKVSREECIRAETKSLAKRLFDGSAAPMLVHFVESTDLTSEEIKELKRILERKGKS